MSFIADHLALVLMFAYNIYMYMENSELKGQMKNMEYKWETAVSVHKSVERAVKQITKHVDCLEDNILRARKHDLIT